jgi:hypothetical protein
VNEVFRAAVQLQEFCEQRGWRYCFIGGLALQRWGEPRETVDVDLTLISGFGTEEVFIRDLLASFEPRVEDATAFALLNRVLLLRAPSGVGLDIALGGLPFSAVARSSLFTLPDGNAVRTCSAEDLIVMKAFAARTKDWLDLEGILVRQTGKMDWPYIFSQISPLAELKGAPEIFGELEKRRIEFGS